MLTIVRRNIRPNCILKQELRRYEPRSRFPQKSPFRAHFRVFYPHPANKSALRAEGASHVRAPGKRGWPATSPWPLICRDSPLSPLATLPSLRAPCLQPRIEAMRGRKRSTRRFAEPLSLRKTLRTFSPISQFPQTRSPAMNFIGVDLHKKSITICVMDEKRKILARKTLPCTQTNEIVEFFRQFRPFKVVVEATASYVWFVELVEPLAEKIVLANPKKLRVIAESTKKTDNLDAQVLTEFLVLDMIPESYQATPRLRQHRALVRHRQYLQGRITSVRSKIRHILSNYNADRKDLFSSNCGLAYLKEVRLNDVDRFVIKQLWA